MKTPIRVLIIEDSDNDKELILIELRSGGYDPQFVCVYTKEAMIEALDNGDWDIIISDYSMPKFSGLEALQIAKERKLDIPFILVSGTIGEELAVKAMKEGANDYLMKDKLQRLIPAIARELKDTEIKRQRNHVDRALKASELKFRVLAESAPVGIFTTDVEGATNFVNPRWCEISGLGFEDAMGFGWLNAIHPDDRQNLESEWKQTTQAIVSSKAEYRFIHPNGSVAWVIGQAVPQKDENGVFMGYIGTITDITERKMIEIDLIAAKEKAEESDRLKTAFLHNISHEIRTPLNSIVGFSGLITDPETTIEKQKKYGEIINQNCDQLTSIITDIIQIATIEAGQDTLHEKEIDLNSICELIHTQFYEKAITKNVSLICKSSLPHHEVRIITDGAKLVQILNNLIGNALKFTTEGAVMYGCEILNNVLKFFVEDTGIGIAPEMHQEIFKRFRQVESATARKFGGSGLGLAISKANVELLGGQIWVESAIGKGAKFYFTIPYKKSEPLNTLISKNNDMEQVIKQAPQDLKILIVEDEESIDTYLSIIFKNIGREILHADNGIDAVEICKKNKDIDLILMDIKMPEMSGFEATRAIRKFNKDVIIIAQTAYALDGDRERTIEAGCNDYITKPINRNLMMELIGKYFK